MGRDVGASGSPLEEAMLVSERCVANDGGP